MRLFYLLGVLALFGLAVVACGAGDTSLPGLETELPDVVQATLATSPPEPEMTVPAVVKVAAPLSTVEPARERPYRSYPEPTGYPGFRVYYQKRCYPGCHSYPAAPAEGDASVTQPTEAPIVRNDRPYRSYPAPTGYPAFRVYYQKRCYPGCHYDSSSAVPTQVHP